MSPALLVDQGIILPVTTMVTAIALAVTIGNLVTDLITHHRQNNE
jgi:hypothetical protein